jgi:nickel/cobalt exporter
MKRGGPSGSLKAALLFAGADAALLASAGTAFAIRTPFGIATPDSGGAGIHGPLAGFFLWIALRQAEFYQALTSALLSFKNSGNAFWLLAGVSFLYGVFHAVGPGHGKSVVTSYLLVTRQTARRGIAIAFAAGLTQALTAIVVVTGAAVVLKATAIGMTQTTDWFLIFSYAMVAAVGAWLLWSKLFGRGHRHHGHAHTSAAHDRHGHDHYHRGEHGQVAPGHGHHEHGHAHANAHANHRHEHSDADRGPLVLQPSGAAALALSADAAPAAGAEADCGHSHAPDPRLLAKPLTVSRAWAAILAVGIRPCTGAIIVLVFALSQGLVLAGIASVLVMALGTSLTVSSLAILAVSAKDVALRIAKADSPVTERVVRILEICVAAFVMLLGLTLLLGALTGGFPGTG